MERLFMFVIAGMLMLPGAAALADGHYQEGTHYIRLDPPIPPVVESQANHEVVELFWYGCPHCYEFEPYLEKWLAETKNNINFVRVPAIFNPRWEQHARAFYALEMMGESDKAHHLMFDGIHEQGRALPDLDSMARFLAANGVDDSKFREFFNSFAMETKINRAKQLVRQYQLSGVPTVIVDGTFKTSASTAGGYAQVLEIVEKLTAGE